MNVLISEDDDSKFNKIQKAIYKILPNCDIRREISVRGTLGYLKQNVVDVLIQDMNLPIFDDERDVRCNVGLDVVFTVEYDEIPISFKFVCSSDKDKGKEFEEEFNSCGFKFVHFDATRSLDVMFDSIKMEN